MMRPKLIAKMMIEAVIPAEIVPCISDSVGGAPSAICTSPLIILNRYTPGIIDTTEAKPIAPNGTCERRETGASISPTTIQAISAPTATPQPNTLSATHRSAWASMPTATGQGSMFNGVEKKTL